MNKINSTVNLINQENEKRILYQILRKLNIHDIELDYDKNGLVAKDDDNVWHGIEFYDFLVNEAIVFEDDNTAIGIPDELIEDFKKLYEENDANCKKNNDNKENENSKTNDKRKDFVR